MNIIKRVWLKIFYRRFIIKLDNHPISKGRIGNKIQISNVIYEYIDDFLVIKSKNQTKF